MPSVKISYRNFHLNEFVANALLDNIGSKKQPLTSEKNEVLLSFKCQKYRVRVNHKIKNNQKQLHKLIIFSSLFFRF